VSERAIVGFLGLVLGLHRRSSKHQNEAEGQQTGNHPHGCLLEANIPQRVKRIEIEWLSPLAVTASARPSELRRDPLTLAAAAGGLAMVAAAPRFLPARRAAALDPVQALREQ
jgi:hypothetical protein